MIEAVNSVVSNASALRGSAEQVSTARSLVAGPGGVQAAAGPPESPKAPYISPYISLDYNYDRAVLQIRDSDTGEVQAQFPTESRLAAQQRAEAAREQASARLQRTDESRQAETRQAQASTGEKAPRAEVKTTDIVSVQEAISATPSNTPQAAVAALSAGAQAGQATSSGVSVLA